MGSSSGRWDWRTSGEKRPRRSAVERSPPALSALTL